MKNRVFSNAIWNAVNGSSGAIVAVIVPPFLTRQFSPEAYGAWALALQIGTYVNLFGFGIQMAVGRYVAYHEAQGSIEERDGIVATAFWFLSGMTALAMLAIAGIAVALPMIVPELPQALMTQARTAVVLVGLSLSFNLPTAVFAAVFAGRQEAHVPALIQGGGRLMLAAGLIAAGFAHNLGALGLVYLIVTSGTAIALWLNWRRRTHAPTIARHHASLRHGRELAGFCFSLTIWNLAMLLVSGIDLLIVGRWDFAATPYYAVSVTLVTLIAGTLSSLANALVPVAAVLAGDKDGPAMHELLLRSARLIAAASILAAAPLIFAANSALQIWLGPSYALKGGAILSVLASATLLRNAMLPYVTIAIGAGEQRRMIFTPIIEGLVSVIVGVTLAQYYGGLGVAYAKIIGGIVGVLLLIAQHPLRFAMQGESLGRYLTECLLPSALAVIAIGLACRVYDMAFAFNSPYLRVLYVGGVAFIASWLIVLPSKDRRIAIDAFRSRLHRGRVVAGSE